MHKKDHKKDRPNLFLIVVLLIFTAFTAWFFATDQVIVGIMFASIAFVIARRVFDF